MGVKSLKQILDSRNLLHAAAYLFRKNLDPGKNQDTVGKGEKGGIDRWRPHSLPAMPAAL